MFSPESTLFALYAVVAGAVVLLLIAVARKLLHRGPGATRGQQPGFRDTGEGLIERNPKHID